MAEQIQKIDVDKLSESVNSLQKCLECTICLQLMIEPTKTRCGHSFCKSCIGKVLRKKTATCPLCKKNLNRRNVSKDDHLEACIRKFKHLVTAIQLDSNIDILSHSKPRNTRESYTSIMVKRDDSIPADENENAIFSRPDVKVRTWLYHMADEPSCIKSNNLIFDNHNELNTTDINENDKSNRRNRRKESLNKQSIDHMEDTNTEDASHIKKGNLETKKLNEEIKTDSATTIELKYKAFHATIREKLCTSKLNVEKTNNQNNSSLTTVNDQTRQISMINNSISSTSSAIAVQSSSADWTRMIEFGKETKCGKKRKMKKLNVSTEKNKDTPRIIENVALSPNKKYNLTKIVSNNNNKKKKNNQKENTIDKNLDLSSTNVMSSEELSETDTRNQKESAKDNANSSLLSSNQLSIKMQEEENERIRTMNLSSSQMNEIIGFENVNKNCQASQNRCREESPEIVVEHYDSLLPSPKKLIILTPQKLNESVREHEIIRDIAQTPPVDNFGNLSPTENRTSELERNNNTQRTLEKVASSQSLQSPISKARLSLKRKSGIEEKKKTDSPLLDQVPLIGKLSIIEKDDINDRKYIHSYPLSKDGKLFDRLSTVKRDLNLKIIDEDQLQTNRNRILDSALLKKTTDQNASKIICQEKLNHPTTLKKSSKNIKNQRRPVKFLQKGTMIRRRNVKYFYLGTTKRESAQVCNIASVYNMQQSISKFDMLQYNIMNMSCNLARSPNRSNDSQDTMDITVMENISSVTQTISRDAELSAASPHPREISATSMPKKDIDHQKKTTMIEDIAEKSVQSPHKIPHASNSAIKKISRVYSGTSNSIKLLSPDKDSQLKFLAIDSPMSEHGESGRANSTRQQFELEKPVHTEENNFPKAKNSHFAASTSKAQELFIKDFDKKKRTSYISDKELFDDNKNDSDSASDSDRCRIKRDRYNRSSKNAGSSLDASKKHRSNSSDDQDVIEVISLNSKEQDTRTRKFRRILQISSSDTESESTEHIARNCKRPRADDQSDQRNASIMDVPKKKCLSIRNPSEEKLSSHRPVNRQKGLMMRESDMFESNSIFNSENLDYILQQSTYNRHNGSKKSEKIAEASNDDIINRVLQINRSQNNSKACRSLDSAPRNIETSQKEKNSGECCKSLLQDNFDEIIANVELPQSHEDMIPCTDQPIRSNLKSRLLTEQRTPNCLAMTDEPCGTAQETPILSASSTHDIFEYFPKNLRKRRTIVTLENLEKETVESPDQKRHDCTVDRRERKNITASANTINIDPCGRIILKHNLSHGREEFSEEFSSLAHINASTDRPHIDNGTMQKPVVGNETTDDFFDSLMDVTQHQVQLQKFEKELFDIPVKNQNQRTTKITLQEDSIQEKQHTPEKRKKDTQDEKAAIEALSADEDDVVEKTPERKMKTNGNNMKLHESRKNLSYLSPISKPHFEPPSIEQTPSTSKIRSVSKNDANMSVKPLYHSTPQNSINKLKNACQQPNRQKLCFICSGLTATRLAIVKEFATTYNINFVNQFESDITHVIVNTIGEKNAAKSTLKFLQGIAHRKWIVSYKWIEDCIEQGKLLDETPFEAMTLSDGIIDDGPQRSRLRKKDLFEGFTFWCVGPYLNVSPNQYESLLLATGAIVVDSLETLAKKEGMKGIVIQDGVHDDKEIEHWYRTAKAAPISDSWIVNCISNYKLFNLASYVHLSLQDLYAIGFPQELVGEYSDDEE